MSMDNLGNVHGLSGKSGQCPWILWTKSREPTQTGQCPWAQWTVSMENVHGLRDSVESVDIVQSVSVDKVH